MLTLPVSLGKPNVVPMRKISAPLPVKPQEHAVKFGESGGSFPLSEAFAAMGLPPDVDTNPLSDPLLMNFVHPVNSQSIDMLNANLLKLASAKKKNGGSLKLLINTPGGEVYAGLQATQIIKRLGVPVDTFILGGQAASMGSLLFMSGTGRRVMTPDSTLMIHEPALSGEIHANLTKLKAMIDDIGGVFHRMQKLFADKTGLPMSRIEELTGSGHDIRIYPLKALQLGFATHVLLEDGRALTKDALKGLSDNEIEQRDHGNDYSGLKSEEFDPQNLSKANITEIQQQYRLAKNRGGGRGGPSGHSGMSASSLSSPGDGKEGAPAGMAGVGMVTEKTTDKTPRIMLFA